MNTLTIKRLSKRNHYQNLSPSKKAYVLAKLESNEQTMTTTLRVLFDLIKECKMNTLYRTWQDAFIVFVRDYGHNYSDSYNMTVEFEAHLRRNRQGMYFLKDGVL